MVIWAAPPIFALIWLRPILPVVQTLPLDVETPANDVPTDLHSTLQGLIDRGQSLECDFTPPTHAGVSTSNGKVWTTGRMGRSQISANIGGAAQITMEANALFKNGEMNTWVNVNGRKTGFHMSQAEAQARSNSMTAEQKQQAEQFRAEMVFNCHPWTVDESKFTLPTDVTFQEM
jgi:hypothetical protein